MDAALIEAVAPAVERLASFMDGSYRARAPASVGLSQYPGGRAYYQFLIRRHTSLSLTPEQIHEIGVSEVTRLEAELDKVRQEATPRARSPSFTLTCAPTRASSPVSRKTSAPG